MALEKMSIQAYEDVAFNTKVGNPYKVLINPAEYSHKLTIQYYDPTPPGGTGPSPVFDRMGQEAISFTIWFDGTGVVPGQSASTETTSVVAQISTFKKVVFNYSGDIHSPNYLEIGWGTLLFKCRLVSLDLTYTMFQPSGVPIRAKCAVSLSGFTSQEELEKGAAKKSPDMSRLVSVKSGDTLPLLCYRVYGTSVHYAEVARVNGLFNFRNLTPGTQLLFPPLRTPTA